MMQPIDKETNVAYISSIFSSVNPSSPVVSNSYTSECSGPYWSNPPFFKFLDTRALWQSARMSKNSKGGLDQYGNEYLSLIHI